MKVVKVVLLKIFDTEIEIYNRQKENFEKETSLPISDEEFVRTFIYNDVVKDIQEQKE